MLCIGQNLEHRPKDTPGLFQHMTAMVARPVSRTEMRANEKAMIAAQKEWQRLRGKQVWEEYVVLHWSDTCANARKEGT